MLSVFLAFICSVYPHYNHLKPKPLILLRDVEVMEPIPACTGYTLHRSPSISVLTHTDSWHSQLAINLTARRSDCTQWKLTHTQELWERAGKTRTLKSSFCDFQLSSMFSEYKFEDTSCWCTGTHLQWCSSGHRAFWVFQHHLSSLRRPSQGHLNGTIYPALLLLKHSAHIVIRLLWCGAIFSLAL